MFRFRDSEQRIDYIERSFLNPLKQAETKTGRIVLPEKDRRTLRKICGVIETNALYLTGHNEVAGKLNYSGSFELKVQNFHSQVDSEFSTRTPLTLS